MAAKRLQLKLKATPSDIEVGTSSIGRQSDQVSNADFDDDDDYEAQMDQIIKEVDEGWTESEVEAPRKQPIQK